MSNLNPDIRKIRIGRVEMREVEILPLSLGDQLRLDKDIEEFLKLLDDIKGIDQTTLFMSMLAFIKEKLPVVIQYVIDPNKIKPEDIIDIITNNQAVELAKAIYDMNYKEISKNVGNLLKSAPTTPDESEALLTVTPQ
jgi:hypothetical protein